MFNITSKYFSILTVHHLLVDSQYNKGYADMLFLFILWFYGGMDWTDATRNVKAF